MKEFDSLGGKQLPTEVEEEIDETEDWNMDDFENIVYENDWIFIGYFKVGDIKRKFTATQEGFMTALDEYGVDNLIKEHLEIISGKEWLNETQKVSGL